MLSQLTLKRIQRCESVIFWVKYGMFILLIFLRFETCFSSFLVHFVFFLFGVCEYGMVWIECVWGGMVTDASVFLLLKRTNQGRTKKREKSST